ncbi:zinc metalloprotease [Spirosoma taeanense]|uniref:Zinc metalloprotease n=1 Tax=Spirosoma taeanense TaxID=2735870 RepID=A0A6M5Y7L9_9BACT|nr:zinc metalloprotease [Spirosoma taeanense]QJW88712.1 zinc metalloprotease [Spirosoma taeanense]
MRKFILPASFLGMLYVASACLESSVQEPANSAAYSSARGARTGAMHRTCASHAIYVAKLQRDPALRERILRMEARVQADTDEENQSVGAKSNPYQGTITIPVIVNVLYSNPSENVSDAQIASQIAVLNQDFNRRNPDVTLTPSLFKGRVGDMQMNFVLAGVNRKASNQAVWQADDSMKFSALGGIDVTQPDKYLNMWVCRIEDSGYELLGYAQFPGFPPETDGVVINPRSFGTIGQLYPEYNKGRTATHEIGHWLSLQHIWGDGPCGVDDYVRDTPDSDSPNFGCPAYPTKACGGTLMTMNFMDYSDDPCMYMFSRGQVTRSRWMFSSPYGPRQSFVASM